MSNLPSTSSRVEERDIGPGTPGDPAVQLASESPVNAINGVKCIENLSSFGLPEAENPPESSDRISEARDSLKKPALENLKEIRASTTSLQSTDMEVGEGSKVPITDMNYSIYDKNQSFKNLFCNAFCFYNRVVGVFFTHNVHVGRAYKSLNLVTQMAIVSAIVCAMGSYTQDQTYLSVRITCLTFFLMRFIQLLLSLGLVREKSTSKMFS